MSPVVSGLALTSSFFFSREEPRLHIHVLSGDGEAKCWLEPEIELARSVGFSSKDEKRILELVIEHEEEVRDAWNRHFSS